MWLLALGAGQAAAVLGSPRLRAMAARYNASASQVVLSWQWLRHGVAVNPEAQNPAYQRENLDFLVKGLSTADMDALDNWH